jgi:hypothetical protein
MASPLHTSTVTAAIVPEIWSARFYSVLRASLPFISSVDTSYEGEIRALGNTINISTIADFDEAGILAEGAAGDTELASITKQQLVINKRVYKDFSVSDESLLQSLPYMDSLREKAVFSILKRMQQLIIDIIVPSASAPDNTIGFDSGTTLGLADILEAKELLDGANVMMENRIAVLGAAQWNDLFLINGFMSREFIPAGSPLTTGDIATPICGFTPKMTTVVGNTAYFFHPSFLTVAVQKQLGVKVFDLGVEGVRAARVNTDLLMGLKQLSNVRVVTIA